MRWTSPCLLLMIAALPAHDAVGQLTPAQRAIAAIQAEGVRTAAGTEGWRLPLAASWNMGDLPTGFTPAWQTAEINQGQYLLPWFGLSVPRPPAGYGFNYPQSTDNPTYYDSTIRYLAANHLPLAIESTQWEVLLPVVSAAYKPGPGGNPLPLSPFDPVPPWYDAGRAWASHPTLRRLEQLYPDPPLVLFVSNNEQPKLGPPDLRAEYSPTATPAVVALRRAIGDAWIQRYRELERGFREGLDAPTWRANSVFIGYDAFATPAMGRWSGWPEYSLYAPGRTEPWPYAWDGASASYYLHDWAPDSDFMVWSPQVEAMNFVPVLAEVRSPEPDFWFEISVWDGQRPGQPTDKRLFYAARGQQFTPPRYGGMVQFGMWLLRPRVVREFRNPDDDRIRFGTYFDAIAASVARVHDDATLRSFWRAGRLLANPAEEHPYEVALPAELASRARWYLLDAAANPPRPWQLTTQLRVYALALEIGTSPRRQWLVYAFSPLDAQMTAEVTIPAGPKVRAPASTVGAFALVNESDGSVQQVGL